MELAKKSQKGGILGVKMVCKRLVFRVIKLVSEDWLHWLIGFAGISCLWLSTCVDEVGWWPRTYWSQNERAHAKSQLVIELPMLVFDLDGWLQSYLGIRKMRYFVDLI